MLIQSSTKKGQGMIYSFHYAKNRGNYTELYQVYNTFSNKKARALEYCKELQYTKGGRAGVITSHNSMVFAYAFLFVENDTPYLMYITRDNDYKIPLIDNKTGEIYLHEYLSAAGLF